MAETKPLWGVYIKKKKLHTMGVGDKQKLSYELIIGKFKKGSKQIFVSNHAVKQRLSELAAKQKINGKFLGHISFAIMPSKKGIAIGAYCPFSRRSTLPRDDVKSLRGLGLASLAEIKVLKDLRTSFPKYTIVPANSTATLLRQVQLKKRNSKINQLVSLTSEIGRIKQYLGKHLKSRRL